MIAKDLEVGVIVRCRELNVILVRVYDTSLFKLVCLASYSKLHEPFFSTWTFDRAEDCPFEVEILEDTDFRIKVEHGKIRQC